MEKNQQMGIAERRSLARLQSLKKNILIYRDSVHDNNIIITICGKKGSRKAEIFREGGDKNS